MRVGNVFFDDCIILLYYIIDSAGDLSLCPEESRARDVDSTVGGQHTSRISGSRRRRRRRHRLFLRTISFARV